jgi:hypothetical protein
MRFPSIGLHEDLIFLETKHCQEKATALLDSTFRRVNCFVEVSVSVPVISLGYFSISVMFMRIWKGQYTGTNT